MRSKVVLWDPAEGSSRFVVGGGSELRMFECHWEGSKSEPRVTTLSVVSELSQLRTFAWSPHPNYPDLMAVGLTTGRTLLLRLDASASPSASHSLNPALSAISLNPRHARPCNAVAFCRDQPGLLAVGLEKARGESLLIFDIEQSARSLDSGKDATPISAQLQSHSFQRDHGVPRNHSPTASPSSAEPRPLLQFGSSEAVTSAAFLVAGASSSPLLAAGMGAKWLRIFDLRAPPVTVATWSSRSVFDINPDPFNGHQFASHGDDGVIKLFDLRKPSDALLSFSEVDAGAVAARLRPTLGKPLAQIAWSPTRRGMLAALDRDSNAMRIWNLADGMVAQLETPEEGSGAAEEGRKAQLARVGSDELRLPVLLDDKRTGQFQLPLASFAFAQSPKSSLTHFVGVSRDASNPGSSGHRIEIVAMHHASQSGFLERSIVLSDSTISTGLSTLPIPALASPDDPDLAASERRPSIDRGRSLSFGSVVPTGVDKGVTPRPSGSVTPRRLSRIRADEGPREEVPGVEGLAALATDPSVVLRDRVEQGYGANPLINATLVEPSIAEFWLWIARAENLAKDACINDFDFRWRGVIDILTGFLSCSASSSTPSTTPSQPTAPHSIYRDVTRSLRRGDEARAKDVKDAAYAAAAAALVSRRRLEGTFAISASQVGAQRRLALQCCGAEWEDEFESVCARLQQGGDYEGAARHAFFAGHLEKAMQCLRLCKDERLRVLAPVLAAYLAQKASAIGSDSVYADLCRSLSSDCETPWIRAMFAFLASGDWREVGDEIGLPLKDRVAVALRFLSDSELLPFLQELSTESLSSGDLSSLLLFGLRPSSLPLLQSYLNRTADLQTIALATSFVSPGLLPSCPPIERWINAYRSTLDRLRLYAARAVMDSARGRRARICVEQAREEGRNKEGDAIEMALRREAPPTILVRCQFCSVNITPRKVEGGGGGDRGAQAVGIKTTLCPNCSKSLPGCSICLTKPSIHAFASDGSSSLCWCQRCRHGGHVDHILEWFARSEVCAVADCDCRCRTG